MDKVEHLFIEQDEVELSKLKLGSNNILILSEKRVYSQQKMGSTSTRNVISVPSISSCKIEKMRYKILLLIGILLLIMSIVVGTSADNNMAMATFSYIAFFISITMVVAGAISQTYLIISYTGGQLKLRKRSLRTGDLYNFQATLMKECYPKTNVG